MVKKIITEDRREIDRGIIGVYAAELVTIGELGRDLTAKCRSMLELLKSGSSVDDNLMDEWMQVKSDMYNVVLNKSESLKTRKRNMSERIDRKISPQLVSIKNLTKAIYNLQKNDEDRARLNAYYGIESLEATHDFMEDYIEVNIHYEDGDTVDLYIYTDASGKATGRPLYRMTSNFDEIESGNGVQLVTIKDIFRYANIV